MEIPQCIDDFPSYKLAFLPWICQLDTFDDTRGYPAWLCQTVVVMVAMVTLW